MASQAQLDLIQRLMRSRGLDFEDVLDLGEEVTGGNLTKLEDLSTSEASRLIEELNE